MMDNFKKTEEKKPTDNLAQEPSVAVDSADAPVKPDGTEQPEADNHAAAPEPAEQPSDQPVETPLNQPAEAAVEITEKEAAGEEHSIPTPAENKAAEEPQTSEPETEPQATEQEDEMFFNRRKIKNLESETKRLSNELEALKVRTVRLNAEYENFRNRTAKEKDEIRSNCTATLLKQILPVMDNLERALVTETDDLPGLKEGVQITLDQFIKALKKIGVELIPTDLPFDPHLHEAVMHEQDPSKGEKEIAEVFLKGYKIGDKVIRHTVVKVVN